MAALEVASLFGTLDLRDNTAGALRNFSRGFDSLEDRVGRFGRQIQGLGGMLTGITAPFVAFGVRGIKVASDFENVLSEIGSRAGLTASELAQVSDFALQMGADTAFSAQEAADAFLQLLTSGQSVSDAMATLPAVLDAAAASGEDLGQTADLVTDILAAFGLGVGDAAGVVDALARAAGASSADMGSLGQGFSNVGPIARQFGISVEETAAILAIFAENGIKGADAGTQLRSMLTQMTRNTEESRGAWQRLGTSMYDATGQVRPIGEVLQEIRRGLAGMTAEQQITTIQDLAGAYGQMGLAALTSNMTLEEMLELMSDSAGASEVAAARMDTFAGRVDTLRGSIQTLQIKAMTPLMDALKPTLERATALVNRITAWVTANPRLTSTLIQTVAVVAAIGAGLLAIGTAITFAAPAIGLLGSLLTLATGPVGLLVGGGLLLAHVLGVDLVQAFQDLLEYVGPLRTQLGDLLKSIDINAIGSIDVGSIGSSVSNGLQNLDFGDVQSIFERHFGDILKLVGTAASIIFGGPVGWVIGIGSLIASAIENDFLGIGTFLKESGISGFVETAFNDIKAEVERLWGVILTTLNLGGGDGTNPIQAIVDWFIGEGDNTLRGALSQVPTFIEEQIIAPLRGIWIVAEELLKPLAEWWETTLLPAIQEIAGWIDINILQPMRDLWTDLQPILEQVAGFVEGLFKPVIDFINQVFNAAADTWEMLRRIGGGTPQRILPGETRLPGATPITNPVGGGIIPPLRDSGGDGVAGQPYLIGRGAQPELFTPQSAGTFTPAGMVNGRPITINIMMPERALLSPNEARERGREFGQAAGEELRKIGGLT